MPSRASVFRKAFIAFLLFRGMLFAFDAVGIGLTEERRNNRHKDFVAFPTNEFLDGWVRWDSGWYSRIVERGYYEEGPQSNVGFMPLYPLAIKAVALVTGNHWIAGLLVSNLSLLFALFFLILLAEPLIGQGATQRSVVYLLVFPTSFIFSAYYTESLFLLLSVLSFWWFQRERFLLSGLAGMLATLTRLSGIALIVAFAIQLAYEKRFRLLQITPRALSLLLIPLGLVGLMTYFAITIGDPLGYMHYQQAGWGAHLTFPLWTFVLDILRVIRSNNVEEIIHLTLGLVSAAAFLVLPCFLFGKVPIALPIFALLQILIPLTAGRVDSMLRYAVVAFPVFFVLGKFGENSTVDRALIFGFALFLGLFNLLFMNWFWAG